jgi:hypothetical protein
MKYPDQHYQPDKMTCQIRVSCSIYIRLLYKKNRLAEILLNKENIILKLEYTSLNVCILLLSLCLSVSPFVHNLIFLSILMTLEDIK